jgi:hypothetical protein
MTPFNFLLANRASLFRSARPTKKPDFDASGCRLELSKQYPRSLTPFGERREYNTLLGRAADAIKSRGLRIQITNHPLIWNSPSGAILITEIQYIEIEASRKEKFDYFCGASRESIGRLFQNNP